VLNHPTHAYTKQLIAAVPPLKVPPPRPLASDNILTIANVSKTYRTGGFLGRGARVTAAVKDASLHLPRGATLGIVGESGSGKSTLARCIVRLIDPDSGAIVLDGKDWAKLPRDEIRRETRHIQMVFQDPFASLNPRRKAAELVAQGPIVHGTPRATAIAEAKKLFELVGLDPSAGDRFPHEFSGGQRQRIGLARALALKPDVLVADEPVSALDVSVQAQVVNLLQELQEEFNLTYLFISHGLAVVEHISTRVAVMYLGRIVEIADAAELYAQPLHPYTQALLSAIPIPDPKQKRKRIVLQGDVPTPINPPSGCRFRTRCPLAIEECGHIDPELREVSTGHQVACIRVPGWAEAPPR
jgi:peptide/nickel transport system ATP-binding protein